VAVTPANFDRVARVYRWLEHVAFGGSLQRARVVQLHHLRDCRRILLLGDGDGRALARILAIAPASRVVSVDASRRMLELSARRIGNADRERVTLQHADARTLSLSPQSVDAVVTQFFLDCFTPAEVAHIVATLAPALCPGGRWLFTDFALPPHGPRRAAGRALVNSLYAFFRWTTGITARALPPSEDAIRNAGFDVFADVTLAGGLLRSVVFTRTIP
jgi:ubiquinone/menaquinone biosynthesis C-methylase UbiE